MPTNNASNTSGYTTTGATSIVWGTPNQPGLTNGFIVVSIRCNQTGEVVYVQNGMGLNVWRGILFQGYEYDITIVDDITFAYPIPGTYATVYDACKQASLSFMVTFQDASMNRKSEGTRSIRAVWDNLVDSNVIR